MRLEPGEQVVVRTRSHPRALLGAASALLGTAFLLGLARGVLARPDLPGIVDRAAPWLDGLLWAAAALAVLLGTLRPLVRWLTGSTVLTTARLIRRTGLGGGAGGARPPAASPHLGRRRPGAAAGGPRGRFHEPVRQVYWRLTDVPEAARFEELLAETTRRARAAARPAADLGGGPR